MASSVSFSGMASGLDTDSIVEAMVSNYKLKADNSAKQEILLEWKQDIYKDVSKKVYNFYTGIASKLRLESTFNQKLLMTSNTTAIKLDSMSTVPSGTHTLSDLKMATSASMTTYQMPAVKNDKKEITSNTLLSKLGITTGEGASISVKEGESGEEKIIKLKEGDTIAHLVSELKTAIPSASVNFDSKAGAFFISSSATGKNQQLQISGSTEVLTKLGFTDGSGKKEENNNGNSVTQSFDKKITTINMQGSDAEYTYNGIDMKSSSNNVSVNGLKFTITSNTKTITTETGETDKVDIGEKIIISSTPDVEGMASTIKSFVEEYNTLISDLNDLINADSAGRYEPLLDDEKEGMTDSQIEKWEKKIKDSLLRNDSTLKSLTSSMRSVLSSTLSTNKEYKSLSSIGITTSSDWTANGKLELDEDKLKEALTNNPDEVIALFSANGKAGDDSTKGLGDKIYDSLATSFKRIANVKSATSLFSDTLLTKQRTTQTETTNKLEDRLETMKEIYYKKFTAMETALSKLNSQTDTLTSLLSS